MNTFVAVFCVALSVANASLWAGHGATLVGPGTHGALLKGPAAAATLVGPDGSHISGHADAGAVEAAPLHGGAITASVAPGYIAHAAPVYHAPVYAHAAPIVPVVPHVAPVVAHKTGTLIDGPSGTIHTSGSAHGLIAATVEHGHGHYGW
ncbi:uncharacterized protein LOC108733271 [Agrilus planipennis]|uniref:Uncharacterized protein LOC108733271 n=1 Tax=Agrilus planipennis TaxID=224129 RepID=A0A1W4WHC7_AGRPL|nr:uncharacterized protein LOC108733271 [Agrilus planipennis]